MSLTRIVVGVDDSEESRAALRWAAQEAALRDIELHVVHAYDWRVPGALTPVGGPYADAARTRTEALLQAAVLQARGHAPALRVRGEAVLGSPAHGLLRAA